MSENPVGYPWVPSACTWRMHLTVVLILHTVKWYFLCSLMLGHLVLGNLEATCWYLCRMEVIPHLQQGQGELGQRC